MKGMKGKLLKKLKSMQPIGYLNQDRVLQVKASNGYLQSLTKNSTFTPQPNNNMIVESGMKVQEKPEIIDVSELMRDLEVQEQHFNDEDEDHDNNKENIGPSKHQLWTKAEVASETPKLSEARDHSHGATPLLDIEVSCFRRPQLNSCSLFDPNLLAAFEEAVKEHVRITEEERKARIEESCDEMNEEEPPWKSLRIDEEDNNNPLVLFEEKCPPWGGDSVVFYTTSLGGIRKTFQDCNSIRFLLESFRVLYFERDISMHKEFKEELFGTLDGEKTVPPRLFVKGRYIGGAEEVLSLHEQGKLRPLFEGMPMDRSNGPCEACGGIRFVLCFNCNGSHKVIAENGQTNQCPNCNENGLIICPHCC